MNENMKKMRLKLDDLKVQSFVTSLNEDEKRKLRGGQPIEASVEEQTLCCQTGGIACYGTGTGSGGYDTGCQCPP